jgi:hypothetical protein
MLSKSLDRVIYKGLLLFVVSTPILSLSALAETEPGNLRLSLEVVNQCNLPVSSYSPSSPNDNGMSQVKVECSNKDQAVNIVTDKTQTTDSTTGKSVDGVSVLVSY